MEVSLKPELEKFLKEKIESGQFQNLDEAINKGVELLKNQEEIYRDRFEDLKREIMIGVEAADQEELIDAEIVFQQIQRKLEQRRNQENHE